MSTRPQKKVLLEYTIKVVVDVQADYDNKAVEFFFDGSSHCKNNELERIANKYFAEGRCLCFAASVKCLGTPSPEEIEDFSI